MIMLFLCLLLHLCCWTIIKLLTVKFPDVANWWTIFKLIFIIVLSVGNGWRDYRYCKLEQLFSTSTYLINSESGTVRSQLKCLLLHNYLRLPLYFFPSSRSILAKHLHDYVLCLRRFLRLMLGLEAPENNFTANVNIPYTQWNSSWGYPTNLEEPTYFLR